MDTRTISRRRLVPAVLAGALLLAPLAGCGDTADTEAAPEVTATESAPAGATDDPTATTDPGATGATGTDGGTNADVNCTGTSCSVTLSGDGAQADILGTPIVLGAVESGRASIRVGDQEIGCSQGEGVSAGPLTLECTTVTEDSVTMTASLG
jgi:hypothetical protein